MVRALLFSSYKTGSQGIWSKAERNKCKDLRIGIKAETENSADAIVQGR